MKAMHRRCAGLDVHQQEIVACRRLVAGRKIKTQMRRFRDHDPRLARTGGLA